jgi:hypothetical protein
MLVSESSGLFFMDKNFRGKLPLEPANRTNSSGSSGYFLGEPLENLSIVAKMPTTKEDRKQMGFVQPSAARAEGPAGPSNEANLLPIGRAMATDRHGSW